MNPPGDGPTSTDLTRIVHEALHRRIPWWQRLRAWLGTLRSRTATMGGYWGGVTMRDPKDRDES